MPAELLPGSIGEGSIDLPAEADQWTFDGIRGTRVELITTSTSGPAPFVTVAEVTAPSGMRIATLYPGDNTALNLAENGTYVVRVRDRLNVGTGTYTIGLEGIRPISPDALPLYRGGIVGGSIDAPIEKDQWTFDGASGQRIELITTSTTAVGGFTAVAEVYAPSGTRIATAFPGQNAPLHLRENGTYLVQVRDRAYAGTGSYTIGLEGISPASLGARRLAPRGSATGAILAAGQKDQAIVDLRAGRRLRLTVGAIGRAGGFRPVVEVYAPSGRLETIVGSGRRTIAIRESGPYLLQFRDIGYIGVGRYKVALRPS